MLDSNESLFSENDSRLLTRIQTVRETIIDKMVENNTLPTTDEDRQFLLKAMDGIERAVFTKAKLKSDDANNKNQNDIFMMITEILKKTEVGPLSDASVPPRSTQLGSEHTITDIVPGEMQVGIINQTYEEFKKRRSGE